MSNPFQPIPEKLKPKACSPVVFDTIREVWVLVPKGEKVVDIDGVARDVITFVPTKERDVPIKEYIESFADDVGIQNILKKVAMTGDKSYLNQTGRSSLETDENNREPVQDYTDAPMSKTDAFNAVAAGVRAYDALPEEIRGQMSFAQFAEGFGQVQYEQYIEELKKKYATTQTEGGNQ